MNMREDRRIRYTKALLRDALIELMQERNISKISVTMLCDRADVHRSTFYTHYADQYELLRQIQDEVLDNIRRYIDERDDNNALVLKERGLIIVLEYLKENAALISALLSDNSDGGFQKPLMQLVNSISHNMDIKADSRTLEYIVEFGLSGCISIIKKWLRSGMRESSEMIAELIMQLTQLGHSAYRE